MNPPPPKPSGSLPLALAAVSDRRSQPRLSAEILGLDEDATLALGVHVRVINVSSGGALLELEEWIRPGTRTELRLSKPALECESERLSAQGQIARCWVHRLSPLHYRAALVFSSLAPVTPATPLHTDIDLIILLERPA